MSFIPTPHGLKFDLQFSVTSKPWAMTGWQYAPDPTSVTQRQSLLTALNTWAISDLMPLLSDQCLFLGSSCTDQSSSTGGVSDLLLTVPVSGNDNNPSNPINACMVVTLQTDLRGRSYRGRQYCSGLGIVRQLSTTTWLVSTVDAFELAWEHLRTDLEFGGQYMVVASHTLDKVPRTSGVLTQVVSTRANARIGSQRRRTGSV